MEFIFHPSKEDVIKLLGTDEMFIMTVRFDGELAVVAPHDEAYEHHHLLAKVGIRETEIERYFRIVFDNKTAEWTFVCPTDYKGITDKTRRIAAFYRDGFQTISVALAELGLFIDLTIPKRYKRHFDIMSNELYQ